MRLQRLAAQAIPLSFYLLFFAVPLVFSPANSELFELPKMVLSYGLTTIIVASWAVKSIVSGRLIFRRTILDIPLLLLLLSLSLSTLTSVDVHTSIWGYYSRSHGGLLSIISYAILYWAFVSNMTLRTTQYALRYLLSSATLVAAWGILEHFGFSPSCLILRGQLNASCWVQDVQNRVFATLGQPNWMAAWLVGLMPMGWALALGEWKSGRVEEREPKKRLLLIYSFTLLLFLALLYTKSRSGLLGFAAAYVVFWGAIFVLAHFSARSWRRLKSATTSFWIFTFLFLILLLSASRPLIPPLTTHLPPPTSTTLETDITPSSEIRRIVWSGAIDAWRARPLFGWGVETFAYVYYQFRPVEHNLTSEWDFLYNKAHNEFLNYLATTGVVGLGSYLLLIASALWLFVRKFTNHQSLITISLFAGYTSILVTNIFGFSVVPVATLFFLFPAMALSLTHHPPPTSKPTTHYPLPTSKHFVFLALVLLTMFYLLLRLGAFWYADVLYERANKLNKQGEVGAAIKNAQAAIRLHPSEPNYYNELAQGASLFALSLHIDEKYEESQEAERLAVEASDKVVEISPRNITLLRQRAVILKQLALLNEKYLFEAINTLEAAVSYAPTEPEIHYNLGVLYEQAGNEKRARELIEKALEFKPDYEAAKEGLEELAPMR